jgi:hypothetical protein
VRSQSRCRQGLKRNGAKVKPLPVRVTSVRRSGPWSEHREESHLSISYFWNKDSFFARKNTIIIQTSYTIKKKTQIRPGFWRVVFSISLENEHTQNLQISGLHSEHIFSRVRSPTCGQFQLAAGCFGRIVTWFTFPETHRTLHVVMLIRDMVKVLWVYDFLDDGKCILPCASFCTSW